MKKQTAMRRVLLRIDLHVLVVGSMVSLLLLGYAPMLKFVPGSKTWPSAVAFGVLPPLVMLTPMVVTRAMDRRKFGDKDHSYLIVNGILVLLFAILCGLLVYLNLPGGQAGSR